jgi:hypothetical protein
MNTIVSSSAQAFGAARSSGGVGINVDANFEGEKLKDAVHYKNLL